MPTRLSPLTTPPTLAALFMSFVRIGMSSFGGGLTAWVRQEIVQRRGWLDDQQFLSGYALSQLVPGATNVNLAVFIGTQMRGVAGALACFAGLTAPPLVIMLVAGAMYFGMRDMPGGSSLSLALTGMGAVAIGLNLAPLPGAYAMFGMVAGRVVGVAQRLGLFGQLLSASATAGAFSGFPARAVQDARHGIRSLDDAVVDEQLLLIPDIQRIADAIASGRGDQQDSDQRNFAI